MRSLLVVVQSESFAWKWFTYYTAWSARQIEIDIRFTTWQRIQISRRIKSINHVKKSFVVRSLSGAGESVLANAWGSFLVEQTTTLLSSCFPVRQHVQVSKED